MEVVAHDHEFMDLELPGESVLPENIDQEICHAFGLQQRSAL